MKIFKVVTKQLLDAGWEYVTYYVSASTINKAISLTKNEMPQTKREFISARLLPNSYLIN